MPCIEYDSVQDKQQRYVQRTLPAIFHAALAAGRFLPFVAASPRELHQLVRNGRYLEEPGPRDCVQPVSVTRERGGDCEDWAAVQLWHAWNNGHPVRLVTAGNGRDNFEHVYVEMRDGGRWVPSNPKGSQQGKDYGEGSGWPVLRRWTLKHDGRVVEVESARGSGAEAEDPLIKTTQDLQKYLTQEQWTQWLNTYSQQQRVQINQALLHGYASYRRSEILARIGVTLQAKAAEADARTGGALNVQQSTNDYLADIQQIKTLEDVNRVMVSFWLADFLKAGDGHAARLSTLRQLAVNYGGNPNAPDDKLVSVAAFSLTQQATSLGVLFDDWIKAFQDNPAKAAALQTQPDATSLATYRELTGRPVSGSGFDVFKVLEDGIGSLINDPGKWFTNIVKDIGRGAKALAENVFDAEKIPFLGDFFLKPLGFHLQATILDQLGNVLVENSVSAFNEKAVARATGETLTSAGRALVTASPFLPPPYNVLAAAVGALSVAAGGLITDAVDENSALNTGQVAPDQVRTFAVDQYGREVDENGIPVDPYQRQQYLDRQAQAAAAVAPQPDPANQRAGEWRRGNDGLFYGWYALDGRWYWLALQLDQQAQITAIYVWTGSGWGRLA